MLRPITTGSLFFNRWAVPQIAHDCYEQLLVLVVSRQGGAVLDPISRPLSTAFSVGMIFDPSDCFKNRLGA